MDPVAEIVDTWLLEYRLLPRKDRRNTVAIFKQLQKDHGFRGGECTVKEYIQKRRGELFNGESSTYVELEHPVGEAQADFGTIHCVRDGKMVEVKERVLTEASSRFQLHHRFEADFCGPARGNEKGSVENKVGYTRRK